MPPQGRANDDPLQSALYCAGGAPDEENPQSRGFTVPGSSLLSINNGGDDADDMMATTAAAGQQQDEDEAEPSTKQALCVYPRQH